MKSHCVLIVTCVSLALGTLAFGDSTVNGQINWVGGPAVGTVNNGDGDIVSTIDHILFSVNTAGVVIIDTLSWEDDGLGGQGVDVNGDGEIAFFDPYIYLFNDDGSLDVGDYIDENDDSDSTFGDGSISGLDSWLSANLAVGNYILTIGGFFHTAEEAIAGLNPGTGSGYYPVTLDKNGNFIVHDHGDYRVTFTGDVTVVPEPTSVTLFGIGVGLALMGRRR